MSVMVIRIPSQFGAHHVENIFLKLPFVTLNRKSIFQTNRVVLFKNVTYQLQSI